MSGIDHSEKEPTMYEGTTRAWRRANAAGMKKVLKKLRKGMTPDQISKKTGIAVESISHLQQVLIAEEAKLAEMKRLKMNTEIFINGEEVK